jgi:uncharacterized protein (TIGR02271 family)
MMAYTTDGEPLGEVQKLDEEKLTIEKGTLLSRDLVLGYEEVADIRGGQVIISRSRADLEEGLGEEFAGRREHGYGGRAGEHEWEGGLPLQEEEAQAGLEFRETRAEEAGMPRSGVEGLHEFREEDVTIPVLEEEVEVKKRPVVKEEVRARKETHTEPRDVSGEVRKEDIKIERGRTDKRK